MIQLKKVSKSYDGGTNYVVQQLDLNIQEGELVVLLGESGCGKTTTLKMINRLIEPTDGSITVGDEAIGEADPVQLRRRIGYVFQGVGLFPHMTVLENVSIVPTLLGWEEDERRSRVDELLNLVHLDPEKFRDRYPKELSGGQRQRVGLARALAARAKHMLMDEPFGALDPITRDHLQEEYRKIHDDLGLTTVMVTHDINESLIMADRIAVMDKGRISRLGTPQELFDEPVTPYVPKVIQTPTRQAGRLSTLFKHTGSSSTETPQ